MPKALLRHATAALGCAVLLSACSHAVDIIPASGGRPGIGDVHFRGGGMTVRVNGKRYSGPFVSASDPEFLALSTPSAYRDGSVIAGRFWGVQGRSGHQAALLSAKDGSSIACRFSYDPPANIGAGECLGDDGQNYALRMR